MAISKHTADDDYVEIEEVGGIKHPGKEYGGNIRSFYPLEVSQTDCPRDEVTRAKVARPLRDVPEDEYCAAVPINDAMSPTFPPGEYIIFREYSFDPEDYAPPAVQQELKDGDIVKADITLSGPEEWMCTWFAEVVRRYGVLPDGRVALTPLSEGFASWKDGDVTPEGPIKIYVNAVATPYKALLHNRNEVLFTD